MMSPSTGQSAQGSFESSSPQCSICAEIRGGPGRLYPDRLPGARVRSRTLWECNEYWLVPSVGPLGPAHLMLVSRAHMPSLAGLQPSDLMLAAYLLPALQAVVRGLSNYEDAHVITFEHGSAGSNQQAGSCIDHCHLHIVGTPDVPSRPAGKWEPLPKLDSLLTAIGPNSPYLLFGCDNNLNWQPAPFRYPCQYLRRHVHSAMALLCDWDWMVDPRVDVMDTTIAEFERAHAERPIIAAYEEYSNKVAQASDRE